MADNLVTELNGLQTGNSGNVVIHAGEEAFSAEEGEQGGDAGEGSGEGAGAAAQAGQGDSAQGGEGEQGQEGAATEEGQEGSDTDADDAIGRYIRGEKPAEESAWTPEAKALLKQEFGVEEPEALKTIVDENRVLKASDAKLKTITDNLAKLPVEFEEAVKVAMDGGDWKAHINNVTKVRLSTPAKDVDPVDLVDHYFKGKFTPERLQEMRDGVASSEFQEAFSVLAEQAATIHDTRAQQDADRKAQNQEAIAQQQTAIKQSRLDALTHFKKNEPALAGMVNSATIDKFLSGQLEAETLRNADGTYKPDAFKRLALPELHDTIMEQVRKGQFAKGELAGQAKERAGKPQTAPARNGSRPTPNAAPTEKSREQEVGGMIDQLQSGKF